MRNRPTLEINAKINDNREAKTALYGGYVAPAPNSYEGKEHAVSQSESTYAVGDAVGMYRFTAKLINSPSTANYEDFARQLQELTNEEFTAEQLDKVGRNITGIERLINARLGLTEKADSLPDLWFDEEIKTGPFAGEKIDRLQFEELKSRYYSVTGLNNAGVPTLEWHQNLAEILTGFTIQVKHPRGSRRSGYHRPAGFKCSRA